METRKVIRLSLKRLLSEDSKYKDYSIPQLEVVINNYLSYEEYLTIEGDTTYKKAVTIFKFFNSEMSFANKNNNLSFVK